MPPSTIPAIAIPWPRTFFLGSLVSISPRIPRMIAGMPVKMQVTKEQIPKTRLAIALPLVRGGRISCSGAKSPSGGSFGCGTISSR